MEQHLKKNHKYKLPKELRSELEGAVLSLRIMPSMRALMTAGAALERDNTAGYNCSYIPIDDVEALMKSCTYFYVVQVLAFQLRETT